MTQTSVPVPTEPAASQDSPIFGAAGGWAVVVDRAGRQCECSGQCGATHRKTEGRCDATHGGYAGKGCPPVRLEVAPEDPSVPEHTAARMNPDQLMAWCPKCRAGAARKARGPVRRKAAPPQDEALW